MMAQAPAPALQLQDVACTFVARDRPGQRYTAVAGVSLTVGVGEFVSVVGPTTETNSPAPTVSDTPATAV